MARMRMAAGQYPYTRVERKGLGHRHFAFSFDSH